MKKKGKKAKPRVENFIDKLQELYPNAFPKKPNPKIPLAIGTFETLLARKEELQASKNTIKEALHFWCRGVRYNLSMVEGANRYTIDGEISGTVTADNEKNAKLRLSKIGVLS